MLVGRPHSKRSPRLPDCGCAATRVSTARIERIESATRRVGIVQVLVRKVPVELEDASLPLVARKHVHETLESLEIVPVRIVLEPHPGTERRLAPRRPDAHQEIHLCDVAEHVGLRSSLRIQIEIVILLDAQVDPRLRMHVSCDRTQCVRKSGRQK